MVDVICPSVYVYTDPPRQTVDLRVAEGQRLALDVASNASLRRAPQVIPFVALSGEGGQGPRHFLERDSLHAELSPAMRRGCDGIIVWGAAELADSPSACTAGRQQFDSLVVPLVSELQSNASTCSLARCHGHGRCANLSGVASPRVISIGPAAATACLCDQGWSGFRCSEHLPLATSSAVTIQLKTDEAVGVIATNISVPHLTGVFVNIDRVAEVWTEQEWRTDLMAMKAVGIEFFIIHHVARATPQPPTTACPLGQYEAYLPVAATDAGCLRTKAGLAGNSMGTVLKVAAELGLGVHIGLAMTASPLFTAHGRSMNMTTLAQYTILCEKIG